MNPGDTLTGRGLLLQHGRLVTEIDYHLTIPQQSHFFMNPTGKLRFDYDAYLGGFILVKPEAAAKVVLTEYTLELANRHRRQIRVERRYKQIDHQGQPRISFWVRVVEEGVK